MTITITSSTTKQDVYKHISSSASYGNLGLFVGTGFSKAVLNDDDKQIALSWGELLEKICGKFDIDYDAIFKDGIGYPEIATKICLAYSEQSGKTYGQALSEVKRKVASLTSWYPNDKNRDEFLTYFEHLSVAWIITTNYDLVIESLLTGKSIPLGPNDQLTNPKNIIPIYHLHGMRTNPEEIVISQEDYVSLFRPNEYRQIKLALTLKESTVLLLGYGLGDVNVLTAIDWSKNVFKGGTVDFPQDVIQVLRKTNPIETPYRDRNGILIVETDEIRNFFNEYVEVRKEEIVREANITKSLASIQTMLNAPTQESINQFIDNNDFRKALIQILSSSPIHLTSGFISYLDKCLTETWIRTSPSNAFEGYNQNLRLLLDILTGFSTKNIPPALFQTAYGLERVAYYIGTGSGESWAAARTWNNRKGEISADMVKELRDIANQYSYIRLKQLLNTIKKD
ncbi:SIR2 family protein [Candidatus Villigracilis saccharophilus]|uniref:SIR2 family NAD-dependent protein deacylase n=1 Tax=Candidatus Villigracilis saccharophilus TaxID=3140684 RepID=UPI0031375D9D|nr:SIR2 family protein [Anaerolineales bacterium]